MANAVPMIPAPTDRAAGKDAGTGGRRSRALTQKLEAREKSWTWRERAIRRSHRRQARVRGGGPADPCESGKRIRSSESGFVVHGVVGQACVPAIRSRNRRSRQGCADIETCSRDVQLLAASRGGRLRMWPLLSAIDYATNPAAIDLRQGHRTAAGRRRTGIPLWPIASRPIRSGSFGRARTRAGQWRHLTLVYEGARKDADASRGVLGAHLCRRPRVADPVF